jgi:hypothetical protein
MSQEYFKKVPNFEYISRGLNKNSLLDYTTVKNLFKRPKVREDIFKNVSYFQKYTIIGEERPDQISDKFYNDPTLDWLVLLANNINNVYEEWPKTQYAFNEHLLQKYGSYENLYSGIHHYETSEVRTREGYIIVEGGKEVNEGFFKAPEYEIELDQNVQLPAIIPGIFAAGSASVDAVSGTVNQLVITNPGAGYTGIGSVTITPPPNPRKGTVSIELNTPPDEREVGLITIIDNGTGYTFQPQITFSDPPPTITAALTPNIGAGGTITSITVSDPGDGYTFTPIITIDPPPDVISSALFITDSNFTVGSGFEGFFMDPLGVKVYTCHGANTYTNGVIEHYELSSPYNIASGTQIATRTLNFGGVSFIYLTGIEFKPDGSRMYVSGLTGSGFKIAQYDLSTDWDISTATVTGAISMPTSSGIRMQDDGFYLYIIESQDPDTIKKYELLVEWNITTLKPLPTQQVNIQTLTGETSVRGFAFKDDGTKLYVSGTDTRQMHVLELGANWDLNTFTLLGSRNIQTDSGDTIPMDAYANPTESLFIVGGSSNRKLYRYSTDITATATATVGVGSTTSEKIVNITVTKAGAGYTTSNLPNIYIQPPIPHRTATGYVLIKNGIVDEVIVVDRGYNYRTPPTAVIENPLPPITATASVKTESGEVKEITLTNPGRGYNSPPDLIFSKPGNLYEPQVNEIFERSGQEWKYDGFNWRKRLSYGTVYFDTRAGELLEIIGQESCVPVTNYQYEDILENAKRNIYILKSEFLGIVLDDIENIMEYKEGSEQYVSRTLKRGDNPRLYE